MLMKRKDKKNDLLPQPLSLLSSYSISIKVANKWSTFNVLYIIKQEVLLLIPGEISSPEGWVVKGVIIAIIGGVHSSKTRRDVLLSQYLPAVVFLV